MKAHQDWIHPIPYETFWTQDDHEPVIPPPLRRMPSRPRNNRRREAEDGTGPSQQRRSSIVKCSTCNGFGHNKTTCQRATMRSMRSKKQRQLLLLKVIVQEEEVQMGEEQLEALLVELVEEYQELGEAELGVAELVDLGEAVVVAELGARDGRGRGRAIGGEIGSDEGRAGVRAMEYVGGTTDVGVGVDGTREEEGCPKHAWLKKGEMSGHGSRCVMHC